MEEKEGVFPWKCAVWDEIAGAAEETGIAVKRELFTK